MDYTNKEWAVDLDSGWFRHTTCTSALDRDINLRMYKGCNSNIYMCYTCKQICPSLDSLYTAWALVNNHVNSKRYYQAFYLSGDYLGKL